jgi:hypothetical protein
MTKSRIFAAAVLLSAAITTPALAEVISEPGNFAFFYPNGDLGLGYSLPQGAMAQMRGGETPRTRMMSVKVHRAHRAPASKRY